MFIGHWAPAIAAAAATPKAPKLGVLFIAGQLVDWAFFGFALFGIEKLRITPGITTMVPLDLYHMPYTHSLLGTLVFAAGFAALIWLFTKNRIGALIGGGVVLSHWFLDLLVHAPDLTIAGSEPKLGFGLWNYPAIEMPLELFITFGALIWFARKTEGKALPLWLLGGVLALVQAVNWFGPPPVEANTEMYITALVAFGVVTAIAWWVGQTRSYRPTGG